jgi:lysophospholipase L1-like esterase
VRRLAVLPVLLLAGCSTAAVPDDPPPVVVALGDSVPAGTACGCAPFPDLYAAAQHATDVNLAVPGSTAADLLAALPSDRETLSGATEVLLMIGANDVAGDFDDADAVGSDADRVRTDVTTVIERIRPVRVVVLGYWNVVLDGQVGAGEYGPDGMRAAAVATTRVNDALRDAATATGATYVPTLAAFHGADGSRDPTGLLAADGDHPNAAGHAAIAALIPPLPPAAGRPTPGPG